MATKTGKVWLERALNSLTALAILAALYLVIADRVLPALRDRPVLTVEGERVSESIRFQRLSAFDASETGETVVVPDGRSVLLLVYNSTCPACYANLGAWRRVLEAVPESIGAFAVALERDQRAAAEYARRQLPGVPSYAPLEPRRFAETLGVNVIPFTALLDERGVLVYARQGRLDSLAVGTLIRALGALQGSSTP